MRLILTALIFAGGLLFLVLGLQFLLMPSAIASDFGLAPDGAKGLAVLRADFPALFFVGGGAMIWGAWKRNGDLLLIPALYLVFPFDFLPDVMPGLGQLDDLGVILLALQAVVRVCPHAAVAFHRRAVDEGRPFTVMTPSDVVIDAEWRRG